MRDQLFVVYLSLISRPICNVTCNIEKLEMGLETRLVHLSFVTKFEKRLVPVLLHKTL